MTHQLIKNIIGVTCITFGFATITSCEPDDVCLAKEAPFVSVELFYTDSTTPLKDTIYYKAYVNDSVLIGEGSAIDKSSFNIPIQIAENNTVKYILQQGKNYKTKQIIGRDTIVYQKNAPIDTLIVSYEIDNKYDSKACGFGIYFKEATFNLISNHWIKNIETVNNTIDNATTTNLYIFANPRSN